MGKEEQQEEREVLDSIFPDEITASLWLTVIYPESYPDVAPRLDLTLPPSAAKIPDLDVSTDKEALLESLSATIEENLGMAMVFTLVSTLKENVEQLVGERRGAAQRAVEEEKAAAEAKEDEKFHGTVVNAETFKTWRDAFVKEMEERKAKAKEEREAEEKRKGKSSGAAEKITGKQLWERGLVGKAGDEEDDEDDGVDALKGIEKLKIKS